MKAPLRAIANLSEWIEEDLEDHLSDDFREHLYLLRKFILRMDALIDGILQYLPTGRVRREVETVHVATLLSEVKKIVESRGSRVWVESELCAGATFPFTWLKR